MKLLLSAAFISVLTLLLAEGALRLFNKQEFLVRLKAIEDYQLVQKVRFECASKGGDPDCEALKGAERAELLTKDFLTDLSGHPKARHPYFGFSYNSFLSKAFNSAGFRQQDSFPRGVEEPQFVVGIFGGSVASDYADYEIEQAQAGKSPLITEIQRNYPETQERPVKIVNFAIGAHKQPQAFYISSHYSDSLSLAVTIDGFNEVAFSGVPGLDPLYPNLSTLLFNEDPLQMRALFEIYDLVNRRVRIGRFAQTWIPRLGSSFLLGQLWLIWDQRLDKRIHQRHLQSTSVWKGQADSMLVEFDPLVDQDLRAEGWKRFTLLQSRFLSSQGIPSLHFVQPNQHERNSKPLTEAERERFFDPGRVESVTRGYQRLRSGVVELQKAGVQVFDLTGLFAEDHQTIYRDNCCHLNEEGQKRLSMAIQSHISELGKMGRRDKNPD